ncbi:GtrA family protein [Desulfobacula sp.]
MKPIVLIPAYKPDKKILSRIVEQVADLDVAQVIIVDDGSGPLFKSVFEHVKTLPKTHVLHHETNQGKGAALRTGFRHVLESRRNSNSVITMDADGQHLSCDVDKIIHAVQNHPESLILGTRGFKGDVPLRSLLGNKATCLMFRGLAGRKISDTQTGLRGIPCFLLETLVSLRSDRYAYELEMLLALVHKGIPVEEITITTVYDDNNLSSSFRPVVDSILVYRTLFAWWFVFRFKQLFRYLLSGMASTIVDFGTYILLINFSLGFVTASVLARILSVLVHFSANRYFTFSYRDAPQMREIARYLMVVVFNLLSSIFLIYIFIRFLSVGEVLAKVIAQMVLFFATYVLLNGFVFLKQEKKS